MAGYETQRAARPSNPFTELCAPPSLELREGRQVKVRAKRAFYVRGHLVEIGETVMLSEHDAISLRALGRAEIVKN